ncbi:MAG: winged helix-turn-helix domain-containing protein [Acidobacteriota bacterium]
MHIPAEKMYEFGPFRLDARRYRLFKNSEQIQLTPKTCEILLLLVERAGELVEKDQIREIIWPGQIIDESNLTHHVYKLRKTLGDNHKKQEYILTIPGKGYIFSRNVRTLMVESDESVRGQHLREGELAGSGSILPVEGGSGGQTRGQARRRSRWGLLILGGALLVLLVMAVLLRQRKASEMSAAPMPQIIPLVTMPGEESDPSFSPDGRYLAFSSEGESQDNQDIYVRMIDQNVVWQVTSHPESDKQPTWSPDGSRLAFLRTTNDYAKKYKLIVVPVRGGVEQEIGEVWAGLSWSPDGKYIAALEDGDGGALTRLSLLPVDGQERRVLHSTPPNVYETNQQFSPDGQQIAFVRWKNNINADLYLLTLASGELRQLTFDQTVISDIQWDYDGRSLYFNSKRKDHNRLWRIGVGGGEPIPTVVSLPNINSFAIAPNGKLLAATQPITDTLIDIFKLGGRDLNPLRPVCKINSSRADDTPRFSPDGSRIVFVSSRSGHDEIWVANADCTNPSQLTRFNQHGVGSPRWSPDGQQIVFDRNIKDNTDIFTIRANGTDIRQLTTDSTVEDMPFWSRDGKWIYFGSYKTSISRIYRLPVGGGEMAPVTTSPGREPFESADGRFLYYLNGEHLWRKDQLNGQESAVPELANVAIGRYWEIEGTTLYYVSPQPLGRPRVMSFDLASRQGGQLFELPGSLARWVPGISFTPRENLLAIGYVTNRHGDISLVTNWR